ncbi:hypothetical protein LZ652_23910, partial [Enterobacter hormaechei]|uniref:hypothetical protein n=1 Tax=Enterobacter hormaechei TaxID=158836 RepID=UPI001F1F3C84
ISEKLKEFILLSIFHMLFQSYKSMCLVSIWKKGNRVLIRCRAFGVLIDQVTESSLEIVSVML